MSDRWLSVEEIAEHLGVSRDTVYTWVNEKGNLSAVAKHGRGRMPAHKVGKLWKFKLAQVDTWVKSGKAAGKTGT